MDQNHNFHNHDHIVFSVISGIGISPSFIQTHLSVKFTPSATYHLDMT